jgi:hypothetical protein
LERGSFTAARVASARCDASGNLSILLTDHFFNIRGTHRFSFM